MFDCADISTFRMRKSMAKNDKKDWDKTLADGFELLKAFTDAKKNYSEWCLKTFGVDDGQPVNLLQLANMIRQMK